MSLGSFVATLALLASPQDVAPFEADAGVRVWPQVRGAPSVTVISSDAELSGLLISFEFPATHIAALSTQAAKTLLRANAALARTFEADLWASNAQLSSSGTQRVLSFALVAPKASFGPLAETLLTGLFTARFDRARYQALTAHEAPMPEYASGEEELLATLEPFLNHTQLSGDGLPRWTDADSMASFLAKSVVPANAKVVLLGTDGQGLERVLRRPRGVPSQHVAPDPIVVPEQTLRGALSAVVVGLPLPLTLSPKEAAVVRVARLLMEERLTEALRMAGYAYTVSTSYLATPAFHGLLVLAPAFSGQGVDLKPTVLKQLELTGARAPTEDELRWARQAVLESTESLRAQPTHFLALAMAGQATLDWLTPAHLEALKELDVKTFESLAPRLVESPQHRFVVKTVPFEEAP